MEIGPVMPLYTRLIRSARKFKQSILTSRAEPPGFEEAPTLEKMEL
jgi:hypothetical protein